MKSQPESATAFASSSRAPAIETTAIEIDPEVVAVARTYFAFAPDANDRVIVGDGRRELERQVDGADVVVVMPHWGTEYTYNISAYEKTDAAAFVAAGADLVAGFRADMDADASGLGEVGYHIFLLELIAPQMEMVFDAKRLQKVRVPQILYEP